MEHRASKCAYRHRPLRLRGGESVAAHRAAGPDAGVIWLTFFAFKKATYNPPTAGLVARIAGGVDDLPVWLPSTEV